MSKPKIPRPAPASAFKPGAAISYRDAGVDIEVGDALVDDIKKIVRATHRPEVLAGVGGFGALVSPAEEIPAAGSGFRH